MRQVSNKSGGFMYAALAGTCAALGSVFGKLALEGSTLETALAFFFEKVLKFRLDLTSFEAVLTIARAVTFALLFLANALMWNFFTKSMNYTSAVEAVVINSSFNFFLTAVLGSIIFGETLTLKWMFGASLIVCGVVLMKTGSSDTDTNEKRKRE